MIVKGSQLCPYVVMGSPLCDPNEKGSSIKEMKNLGSN